MVFDLGCKDRKSERQSRLRIGAMCWNVESPFYYVSAADVHEYCLPYVSAPFCGFFFWVFIVFEFAMGVRESRIQKVLR